jgi:hypothetical protein
MSGWDIDTGWAAALITLALARASAQPAAIVIF